MKERIQAFAGSMMIPVILLVVAGIFIGIGSAFANMENVEALHLGWLIQEGNFLHGFFVIINDLGFMVMRFLPVFFAVGLSYGLARKEKGWAAFAGLVIFLGLNTVINSMLAIHQLTPETTTVEALVESGYSMLEAQNYNSLFGTVLGIFTYDMSIFSGLIAGIVTSMIHNRYCEKQLPNALSFFSGPRYVIILVSIVAVPVGIVLYYIWPYIGAGLASLSNFITTSGLIGTFVFGAADRALLPIGIHHLIAFPIEYTRVGGEMLIDGTVFEGVRNIMLAQMGSPDASEYIVRNFTTGRILFHFGGLPGAALAMYLVAKKENRKKVASIMIPAILTAVLIGVTEPIEYTFLFVQPLLYFLIHVPLSGLSYVLTEMLNVSIIGTAVRDMFPNLLQPDKVHAMSLLILIPAYFAAYFFLFRWAILKFNIKTPGREEGEGIIKLFSKKDYKDQQDNEESKNPDKKNDQIDGIIAALGGKSNIIDITNCATRLRVKVKDGSVVQNNNTWVQSLGAKGVVRNDNALQIIFGTHVITLAAQVKERLGME
ncbi:PTS transporter subunit EIIC [Oceanobacillus neutriphilus]|uniref:PTS glucose transporter subunit IIBC n=1 Tax=Oceanobacillus neutriphilus TaxID=531815 RepID=A0ABQ2NNC9_9BACI|nr:PTS transporter subunit EIIC [Oceanobacillus neutriphilus]GGP07711.1 PTS glucose transporter subunit IIBC [Oceanobacillus neutriphilus]